MHNRRPLAAALLALFASPLPLFAQEASSAPVAPNAAPSDATLQEIVVQGGRNDFGAGRVSLSKLPADLHDVPQSVTVVNKALMQSQGANSLADALRNVSGITLGGAEGGQIGNNINLNGFSARTDVFLDGFRDRGQYYRDTFALDSVEVLMGPSSMLFGRGSTGGAINQVSKKPELKALTDIGASVTSNGLVRTTLDHNTPLSDSAAVRVEAFAQDGDGSTRDQTRLQDWGVAPSIKFGIGTPTEITLQALIQHNHDQPDYGVGPLNGAPVAVARDTAFGYNSDHTDSDVGALTATINHKVTSDITVRDQMQFNYVKTHAIETAPQGLGTVGATGFVPLPTAGVGNLPLTSLFERLQSHDRDIRDYSIYNQTELLAKVVLGSMRHELLAGVELGHDGYSNQAFYRNGSCNGTALNPATGTSGYVACVPALNPGGGDSPASVPTTRGNLSGGSANTAAVYFNDTVSLTDQFKLAGGLRYDRYTASITNSINAQNTAANTALAYARQSVDFTSVRLGGIWQPSAEQSYYLSYGTSFNPSLEQLTGTSGQQNLDPEKNKSYELGGKWDLAGGNLAVTSALFQIEKDNARSQTSTGVYELDGDVKIKGFRAGATGRLNKQLQLSLNYSYLDGRIVGASALDGTLGKVPGNTPKHTLVGWGTYEVAPHWEVGGGPQYLSARFDQPADLVRVGGYTRWDATAAYKQKKYDIRVNLFNLTNKAYFDALIPSDGGRSVPGSGRTVMLSLNYHL